MKTAPLRVVLVFTLSWLAAAQPLTRDIKGEVRDQYGHALGGATVEIENTSTLDIRSFITPASGEYHFAGMSTNTDYKLRAKYRALWGKARVLSKFNSSSPAVVDLTVELEGARNEAPRAISSGKP